MVTSKSITKNTVYHPSRKVFLSKLNRFRYTATHNEL